MKTIRRFASIFATGVVLCGCASSESAQYWKVKASYEYVGDDKSAREWRAYMQALDQCHVAGYQDAQLSNKPEQHCEASNGGSCSLFRVTLVYECFGLGYQTSS